MVVLGGKMKTTIIPTKIIIDIFETAKNDAKDDAKFDDSKWESRLFAALNKVTPEFRKGIGLSNIFQNKIVAHYL